MDVLQLKERLAEKPDIDLVVKEIIADPGMISDLLEIINTDKSSIKFLCTKLIRLVSEKKPEMIYEYFNEISKLLNNSNSFVKWDAIITLSNLASVDSENKFDGIFYDYFNLIHDIRMITAANVIGNAWKVIAAKPYLEGKITRMILEAPGITYYNKGEPSPECNRILCGHIIDCFDKYFSMSGSKREILAFAETQLKNPRRTVARKAEKFLKKYLPPVRNSEDR